MDEEQLTDSSTGMLSEEQKRQRLGDLLIRATGPQDGPIEATEDMSTTRWTGKADKSLTRDETTLPLIHAAPPDPHIRGKAPDTLPVVDRHSGPHAASYYKTRCCVCADAEARIAGLYCSSACADAQQEISVSGTADRRTAGTGGIMSISEHVTQDNRTRVEIVGRILKPIEDRLASAPNYNEEKQYRYIRADHKLQDYEAAHLWGPGFGDEAAAGIMFVPRAFNQEWQNVGIENRVRDLYKLARNEGAEVYVRAVAQTHQRSLAGGICLAQIEYFVDVVGSSGAVETIGYVGIEVDPPPSGRVHNAVVNWKY